MAANTGSTIRKPNPTSSLDQCVTEFQIYSMLDKLRPTAIGFDGFPACMVPSTRSASFLQAHHQTLPSIPCQFICPSPVEASQYPANTKNCCPQAMDRFSTNLHHSSTNLNYGADSRTTLPLSSILVTTPFIDILRLVCFQPNSLHSCIYRVILYN